MSFKNNNLYRFLNLSKGTWRNSVYIECIFCPYSHGECNGHLLICDADGKPVIIGVNEIQNLTGDNIDKTECVSIISRQAFESLFDRWITWNISYPTECSIRQISKNS